MNFLYVFERFVRSMDTTRLIRGKEKKKQRKEKKNLKPKNSQSKLLLELVNFQSIIHRVYHGEY